MKKFFAFEKASLLYDEILKIKFPYHLKDQILRASSSVVLNLAEGSAKYSKKEQARFYRIALASSHECLAVLKLHKLENSKIFNEYNFLGWVIWRLINSRL